MTDILAIVIAFVLFYGEPDLTDKLIQLVDVSIARECDGK